MKKQKILVFSGLLIIASVMLSACSLTDLIARFTTSKTLTVAEKAATVQALQTEMGAVTEEAPTATEEPAPATGTLSGQVTYPSEFIPPERVVAFDVTDPMVYFSVEVPSGGTYTLEVPVGTYVVLAYVIDPAALGATPGLSAAYSKAVPCGLSVDCTDHGLLPVSVAAGETVSGIDPTDWYLPLGEDAGWPSDPLATDLGAIGGNLGFPSEYIPAFRVVAFDVYSDDFYYVDTAVNQATYQIDNIPPGTYNVVAYIREETPHLGGGYSYFVTCGLTVDCTNHSLIDVFVYAGMLTPEVNPVDFYAQPGEARWPAYPTP